MNVVVTVAEGHAQEVADRLTAAGMEVTEVMDLVGIVNGTFDGDLAILDAVPGVEAVEQDNTV